MTITVMLRVDGLTAPRFREFLRVYWMAWERFRYMPVKRSPAWWWEPDPMFDVRHHLDVVVDRFTPESLQEWVSVRLNQPLPMYRPRWKFWLAPNADGLSLLGIFDRLCPPSPQQHPAIYGAPETAELSRWTAAAKVWLGQLMASGDSREELHDGAGADESGGNQWQDAGRLVERVAQKSLKLVHEFSEFLVEPEDSDTDLRRQLLGRRHCRWSEPVPLERFRSIARITNVTINDVLLSCVAAAVRTRLGIEGEDLDEAVLHAAVPVDIRSRLPEELKPAPGALGNYFGTVFVPLPVDGESPLERLYRIKHETRRLKKSWQPGIAWGLAASATVVPEPWREPLAEVFYRKASAVVSNVPGTPEARYIAGCRIAEQMFWVPQAGDIGLGISIVSYAGQVQFGVVADEAVMADPEEFLNDCLRELAQFPGD